MIIDGKKLSVDIIHELKQKPIPNKFMAVFLVGENPASISFVNQKKKIAEELGIDFRIYKYPSIITSDELRKEVHKIVDHKTCGGAVVQLPLPEHINTHYILNVIPREKDVDVLGERGLGAFYNGRNPVLPPAVGTAEKIIQHTNYNIQNTKVAIVGRGLLIGKPIAMWLTNKVSELAVFSSKTESLSDKLKEYDLIITGIGKAGIIKPEMLKANSGVIDFGYDEVNGKPIGDFDTSQLEIGNCKLKIGFYTPTPGGTGPILVAQLFSNFYKLNEKSLQKLSEYNYLAKRGLLDLGINTEEDMALKELNRLWIKFRSKIGFEKFVKVFETGTRKKNNYIINEKEYLQDLEKLTDRIISVCERILEEFHLNSSYESYILLYAFLLMSKKQFEQAIVVFKRYLLNEHDHLIITSLVDPAILGGFNIVPFPLANKVWEKFGSRSDGCVSTLIGDCHLKLGDLKMALEYYKQSIQFLTDETDIQDRGRTIERIFNDMSICGLSLELDDELNLMIDNDYLQDQNIADYLFQKFEYPEKTLEYQEQVAQFFTEQMPLISEKYHMRVLKRIAILKIWRKMRWNQN